MIFKREIRQARILDAQIRQTEATDFSVFLVLVLIFYVEGAVSGFKNWNWTDGKIWKKILAGTSFDEYIP